MDSFWELWYFNWEVGRNVSLLKVISLSREFQLQFRTDAFFALHGDKKRFGFEVVRSQPEPLQVVRFRTISKNCFSCNRKHIILRGSCWVHATCGSPLKLVFGRKTTKIFSPNQNIDQRFTWRWTIITREHYRDLWRFQLDQKQASWECSGKFYSSVLDMNTKFNLLEAKLDIRKLEYKWVWRQKAWYQTEFVQICMKTNIVNCLFNGNKNCAKSCFFKNNCFDAEKQ